MEIHWDDCEPNEENFWENIKRCDKYNRLQEMIMIISGYYLLDGNQNKTPKDLELELRDRNFNVGLIASEQNYDPSVKKGIDDGIIKIVKSNYVFNKIKNVDLKNVPEDQLTNYHVLVSCRPREYVIKETLDHSSSMEENLEKLMIAGELVNKNETKISPDDVILSESEKSLSQLIREGKKLIRFKEVNFEEIFINAQKKYPNCQPQLYAMGRNGESILALINYGLIVCPIGICISITSTGEQKYQFVPLPR